MCLVPVPVRPRALNDLAATPPSAMSRSLIAFVRSVQYAGNPADGSMARVASRARARVTRTRASAHDDARGGDARGGDASNVEGANGRTGTSTSTVTREG